MKKYILVFVLALTTAFGFSQKKKDIVHNIDTGLLETTYYHDNGEVSQKGTFDMAGKLHGEWTSFSAIGEKVSKGSYIKGVRSGKWSFWGKEGVKEVEFSNNMIASVVNLEETSGLAIKD